MKEAREAIICALVACWCIAWAVVSFLSGHWVAAAINAGCFVIDAALVVVNVRVMRGKP